jgi:hypothetical protein
MMLRCIPHRNVYRHSMTRKRLRHNAHHTHGPGIVSQMQLRLSQDHTYHRCNARHSRHRCNKHRRRGHHMCRHSWPLCRPRHTGPHRNPPHNLLHRTSSHIGLHRSPRHTSPRHNRIRTRHPHSMRRSWRQRTADGTKYQPGRAAHRLRMCARLQSDPARQAALQCMPQNKSAHPLSVLQQTCIQLRCNHMYRSYHLRQCIRSHSRLSCSLHRACGAIIKRMSDGTVDKCNGSHTDISVRL